MQAVPAEIRGRIVSGMRWTVWLSALAVPFSYGTSILLARTSPETIGAYGLLMVYIALVASVFYLGGDAVSIKFLPELAPGERIWFLASYFLVICVGLLPWLAVAALWPGELRYLFGRAASGHFYLFALCLSPLPILYSIVIAAMKARLDLRFAQMLTRVVTIGSFLIYFGLFFEARPWLARHSVEIVWLVYFGLTALATGVGLWYAGDSAARRPRLRPRFFLPRGFWSYTLGTQQVSLLGFLLQRLDYVLILNLGGLKTLGEYVAITTLAMTVPLINRFFFDTLLPSLTNLLAAGNEAGAAEVFRVHMRIVFLVTVATTGGLVLLATPLAALFGATYASLSIPVLVLSLLVGLASPGTAGGTLLSSIGKPQRTVWVSLLQLGIYVALFSQLWPRYRLLGAVVALGLSTLACNGLLFIVGTLSAPFQAQLGWDYGKFTGVVVLAGACGWQWTLHSSTAGLIAWILFVFSFLWLGNYRLDDCRELARWFVPLSAGWDRK